MTYLQRVGVVADEKSHQIVLKRVLVAAESNQRMEWYTHLTDGLTKRNPRSRQFEKYCSWTPILILTDSCVERRHHHRTGLTQETYSSTTTSPAAASDSSTTPAMVENLRKMSEHDRDGPGKSDDSCCSRQLPHSHPARLAAVSLHTT